MLRKVLWKEKGHFITHPNDVMTSTVGLYFNPAQNDRHCHELGGVNQVKEEVEELVDRQRLILDLVCVLRYLPRRRHCCRLFFFHHCFYCVLWEGEMVLLESLKILLASNDGYKPRQSYQVNQAYCGVLLSFSSIIFLQK